MPSKNCFQGSRCSCSPRTREVLIEEEQRYWKKVSCLFRQSLSIIVVNFSISVTAGMC